MKFMSAFINHSLLPAKRGAGFQGVHEATSVPFNQSDNINDNKESAVQDFSFKDTTDPVNQTPQTMTSNTSTEESDLINAQVNQYSSKQVETQQLKDPLFESEFSVPPTLQVADSNLVSSQLGSNSSEIFNQIEAESFDEIRNTKLQNTELYSNEQHNIEQINTGTKLLNKEKNNVFSEVINKQDAEQEVSEKISLYKNINSLQPEPSAAGKKESSNETEKESGISHEPQNFNLNFNHSTRAEPVLIPPFKRVENTDTQQHESAIAQSQSALFFKDQAPVEDIPQVHIGQVNVVIDDRSSKPRSNNVRSTGKTVNSFGLRGL
jgi:hypothetical protein